MNIKQLFLVPFISAVVVIIGFTVINNYKSKARQLSVNNQTLLNQNINMKKTKIQIDKAKEYTAVLHTEKGDITISLNTDQTPKTVSNFVTLAKKGFYNKTIFHRIIKGFMIQGGDPKGDGTGGPGYKFDDEPFTGEYSRGTVAMANAGPNTNGSQFFIMHADNGLPKSYVIFGKVTAGIDAVDAIAESPVKLSFSGENSTPVTPIKIISIDVK